MQKKQKRMMVFLFPTLLFHVWRIPENFLRSSRCNGAQGIEDLLPKEMAARRPV